MVKLSFIFFLPFLVGLATPQRMETEICELCKPKSLELVIRSSWLLGVKVQDLNEAMRIALGVDYGVLVTKVIEDSPAKKAGLKIGDVILSMNGKEIENSHELQKFVSQHAAKRVKITVLRKGKKIELETTLEKKEKEVIILPYLKSFPGELKETLKRYQEEYRRKIEDLIKELEKLKKELKILQKDLEKKKT